MKKFKKIIKKSAKEVKNDGVKHFFKSVSEKVKRKEFYIKENPPVTLKEQVSFNDQILNEEYAKWVSQNELSKEELKKEYKDAALSYKPLISIVIPVFNPPAEILKKTLNSVINQIYENDKIYN